ncbi:uncharacterized protein (DUF58 family) [Dysgonomonas sp. PFB1-18]|uniref:DUF58 domain-containing protein n=1 Tax=unclassified Dysgonomonas TaxID=2630389 RepID=UPI002475DE1F|nr:MULTISPECIES: DUF58 domain-containing protein [unclassified Dysgonomonas]MDH6307574.1 uncharacterized protein (DUF58 family) [Dysgonomonas sp. PF1-14]MDH6337492.1 uncharacterized protein (DUF58 family) [Dysgonomonas sp. PF1-16]MDH6378717.1 uncharacterized protein (DUF58 family) [Dysgonomonas sp. PFB1-18]MDH6399135.1 uncharacterized protein (DUF58 family) [Dysgonomonas sp. PF1-23]
MPTNRQSGSSPIIRFFKSLYLTNRFFVTLALCVMGFFACFIFDEYYYIMQILFGVFCVFLLLDIVSAYRQKKGITASRNCPERLSNGDVNTISIEVSNRYPYKVNIKIIEEVPFQFQKRDLTFNASLDNDATETFYYDLRPTQRGLYLFGALNIYAAGIFGFVSKRYIFDSHKDVAVYPSFIEMHKYELLAASHRLTDYGIKKIRRIGHATEFDQIKHYTFGDDPRTINYKATARMNQLMVNTYQEEKSQPVYCLIDKGRTMKMPFNEMTLLDYAINSTLMVCSTALNKGDKAGLITFSKDIDELLPADKQRRQRNKILETLYAQRTDFKESDYERLYVTVRRKLTQRSLIILYTNFETVNGMRRQLRYLGRMAKDHLVLVAFFLNSEFNEVLDSQPANIEETFRKGMAEKLSNDKFLIVKELNRHGIHTILSKPENLTINSINKYLEFKARGLI